MALASTGFVLTLITYDAGYNQSIQRHKMPAGTTYAEAAAALPTFVTDFQAVSNMRVFSAFVSEDYQESTALSALVVAGAQAENVALVVVPLVTAGKDATLRIPAPVDGIFSGTVGEYYNIVDINDNALQTYVGLFRADPDGIFEISDGEHVNGVVPRSGHRIHRASRKG